MFKPGDRVKLVDNSNCSRTWKIGNVFIISAVGDREKFFSNRFKLSPYFKIRSDIYNSRDRLFRLNQSQRSLQLFFSTKIQKNTL